MKRGNYKLTFVFIILAVASAGCNMSYKNVPFVSIPAQPISGAVEIGGDWKEIVPPQPLEPLGATNWISLGYTGYKDFKSVRVNKENILELADGRSTKVEGFLVDDQGQSYELELNQTSDGPRLYKKGAMKMVDGKPDYSETMFPADRQFTKLKIRSDIALKLDKIEWIGSNPK